MEKEQHQPVMNSLIKTPEKLPNSPVWLWLAIIIVSGYLVYLLAPVLTPFAVAALFAYLGDPIADWLENKGISRTISVVIVFVFLSMMITMLLLILIPTLNSQIGKLIDILPVFFDWARAKLDPLLIRLAEMGVNTPDKDQLLEMIRTNWQEAGGLVANILSSISKSGMAVLGWTMNIVLIPVVTFYLLRDWDVLKERIQALLPRHVEPVVTQLATDSNSVLGSFLRGQLTVMLALGVIYAVGLWIIGLDLGILIGMIAGLISFVPYLGTIVGVGLGVIAVLFEFGDVNHLIAVLVVFGIGQILEGVVLTPLLVGDRIGLHPVAVIFAVLAGGQLFGFLGVLLALPAASIIMVMLRYAHKKYKSSSLYGPDDSCSESVLEPEAGSDSVEQSKPRSEKSPSHKSPDQSPALDSSD